MRKLICILLTIFMIFCYSGASFVFADDESLSVRDYQTYLVHVWDAYTGSLCNIIELGEDETLADKMDEYDIPNHEDEHMYFHGVYTNPEGNGIPVSPRWSPVEDCSIYNVYVKKYKLTIDGEESLVDEGYKIPNYSKDIPEGYKFEGWHRVDDDAPVEVGSLVTDDINIYANIISVPPTESDEPAVDEPTTPIVDEPVVDEQVEEEKLVEKDYSPITGDNFNPYFWLGLLVASILGLGAYWYTEHSRKSNLKEEE